MTSGSCSSLPEPPTCDLRNLVCPATCETGKNFSISYDYKKLDPGLPMVDRQTDRGYAGGQDCLTTAIGDTNWHNESRSMPCASGGWTGSVKVSCMARNSMSGICTVFDTELLCNVQPVSPPPLPTAIGYVKVMGPIGIIKLRLISFTDALAALKGIIKVARFTGDTNTAADLVETTDPNASPVRVMTPYGVKSWRKAQ
ncbi:MAG: hypothetical protein PHU56_01035 [Candidatus Pacebacteria bacterium]|nr:hypothetical protein [Candidatus Paceibacterota bacterium]